LRAKPSIAGGIVPIVRVLSTIEFDNQTGIEAKKIHYVRANRNLPPE
jgi:hypothetical protein